MYTAQKSKREQTTAHTRHSDPTKHGGARPSLEPSLDRHHLAGLLLRQLVRWRRRGLPGRDGSGNFGGADAREGRIAEKLRCHRSVREGLLDGGFVREKVRQSVSQSTMFSSKKGRRKEKGKGRDWAGAAWCNGAPEGKRHVANCTYPSPERPSDSADIGS